MYIKHTNGFLENNKTQLICWKAQCLLILERSYVKMCWLLGSFWCFKIRDLHAALPLSSPQLALRLFRWRPFTVPVRDVTTGIRLTMMSQVAVLTTCHQSQAASSMVCAKRMVEAGSHRILKPTPSKLAVRHYSSFCSWKQQQMRLKTL